ncbi:MAG: hypothetical protein AAB116_09765 [Candidatus Poribacteria bacterium]
MKRFLGLIALTNILILALFLSPGKADGKSLTLDNIFLVYADLKYWEPGDREFYFPRAGEVFYGFRPLSGVSISVSENCKKHMSVAGELRSSNIVLRCSPNGDVDKTFIFATSSKNWTNDEDIVEATSFTFSDKVSLKQISSSSYSLVIEE